MYPFQSPDPDGAGPLKGTDAGIFRADANPLTTTSATNADTDGDGFSDGAEDANRNGALDVGESDPGNAASTPGGGTGNPRQVQLIFSFELSQNGANVTKIRCLIWFGIPIGQLAVPAWILTVWHVGWDVWLVLNDVKSSTNFIAHVAGAFSGYLIGALALGGFKQEIQENYRNVVGGARAMR